MNTAARVADNLRTPGLAPRQKLNRTIPAVEKSNPLDTGERRHVIGDGIVNPDLGSIQIGIAGQRKANTFWNFAARWAAAGAELYHGKAEQEEERMYMTEDLDAQTQQPNTDTPVDIDCEQASEEAVEPTSAASEPLGETVGAGDTPATEGEDQAAVGAESEAGAGAEAQAATGAEGGAVTEDTTDAVSASGPTTAVDGVVDPGAAVGTVTGPAAAETPAATPTPIEAPIEVSSEEELDAVMDSMMDAVQAMKEAAAPADPEEAEAASSFVPGETPVADPGTSMPSFLQLEHPTIGTDAVEPHTAGFSVIEGGTDQFERQRDAASATGVQGGTAPAAAAAQSESAPVNAPATQRPAQPQTAARQRDLGTAVADTANAVGTFIAQGASAMREMNAAKKALTDARAHLEELDRRIADQTEELETRQDIAARYPQIVAEQQAAILAAQKAEAAAEISRDEHKAKADELKAKLAQVKEEDAQTERRLKAAVDAVEARESSSRENGNRLTRRVEDARRIRDKVQAERDAGVAAAKQTVDAAKAQLETLRKEYAELQRNPSANSANYTVRTSELSSAISDAADALRKAEDDLPRVTADLDHSLAAAVEAVKQAESPIGDAKRAHQAVTTEADAARDELQSAKAAAAERQRDLREQIAAADKARREQEQAITDARSDAAHAQELIDQATEVHEHPEVTEAVAGSLARDRAERQEAEREVAGLEAAEQNVRERTRESRVKFTGAIACIIAVIVVVIVLWLFLTR